MRVVELRDGWSLEHVRLGARPEPTPGPHEVVVEMAAASVNFRDLVTVRRGYGRGSGELPFILLSDGAGHVVETGPGVTRVQRGDLVCPTFAQLWIGGPLRDGQHMGVLGGPRDGVMQERMLLSEEGVVKAPRHFTPLQAATLPCAALTAWHAVTAAGVKPGDVVVTQGTGGVSLFAMQFARSMGALTVVTSSSDAKLARAEALGAHHGINYTAEPHWHRALRRIVPDRGADLVVELGGAASLDESLRAVRPAGSIALIGVLSGALAQLDLGRVVTRGIRLAGVTVGSRDMFEDMVRAIELHRIEPAIDARVYGFDETAAAIAAIGEGRHFGKICIAF
jgi:NADPH:quinone reductase-like Zn-dependent oxidoreductase